jgi:hypothetical protein
MFRALLLISFVLLSGCASARQVTRKLETPAAMTLNVTQIVANGTSVDDAIAVMQSEGFECTVERQSKFDERRHWSEPGEIHENIDFIRCRRVDSAGFLMSRYWNVAIVLNGDTTSEVLVSHFIDGP